VRVGNSSLRKSGSSSLQGNLESYCVMVLCLAPLWLGEIRGKKSTPSVGLEVPVKSLD
jgi:hypothetical protein